MLKQWPWKVLFRTSSRSPTTCGVTVIVRKYWKAFSDIVSPSTEGDQTIRVHAVQQFIEDSSAHCTRPVKTEDHPNYDFQKGSYPFVRPGLAWPHKIHSSENVRSKVQQRKLSSSSSWNPTLCNQGSDWSTVHATEHKGLTGDWRFCPFFCIFSPNHFALCLLILNIDHPLGVSVATVGGMWRTIVDLQ